MQIFKDGRRDMGDKRYTSCGGTLNVVVRRSTLTMVSTQGKIKNNPGPFAPPRIEILKHSTSFPSNKPGKILPKRKITAR